MFINAIQIGMADYKVAKTPEKLATIGLGSCVAICVYDFENKTGGLVHVMLPDSTIAKEVKNPAKFADTAVPMLLDEMGKLGSLRRNIHIKIAGGAHMFSFKTRENVLDIGARNVEIIERICKQEGINIIAKDVGGNCGRSVLFDLATGIVYVKTINQGVAEI